MLIPSLLKLDGEYTQLLAELEKCVGARALPFVACGLCDGAADALMAGVLSALSKREKGGASLVLLSEEKECVRLQSELSRFGLRAAVYTARDLTFYNITASHDYEYERVRVLWGLLRGDFDVVLTTPDAALGYTVSRKRLLDHTITLDGSTLLDPAGFSASLLAAGYARVEMVEGPGQFAVRGGIVDVYAPNMRALTPDNRIITGGAPLRIELFGDEIDRMGLFDVESQRLHTNIVGCELPPAREVLVTEDVRSALTAAVEEQLKKCKNEAARDELSHELADLRSSLEIRFADKYLTLIDPDAETILSYFGAGALVILRGTNAIYNRLKASLWRHDETVKELIEGGTVHPRYAEYSKRESALDSFLDTAVPLHVDSIAEGVTGKRLAGLYSFHTKHTVAYGERMELLFEDLEHYRSAGQRVILVAENETSATAISAQLREKEISVRLYNRQDCTLPEVGEVLVEWQEPSAGFELPAARVAVLSMALDVRHPGLVASGRVRAAKTKRDAKKSILSYGDLHEGDLVVHDTHGIGRYMGMQTLTIGGVTKDYVSIQYAGTDKLFLPCERLDSVSKYIGAHADDGMVKLSRFGGGEWKKAKARAKAAVKDMAKDLIRLYAERERRPGFAFPADEEYQADFEAAFAFEETEGQIKAANEIKEDMMLARPMDRLLCGDVGFGKTEVALRAAYKAVLAGKQVAILVPTTILALQHFQTLQSRMRAFAVRVDMISRFRTPRQQEKTLRALSRGDVDIIVGTHRLLSGDVAFKDLGLLIVDEEQRFGVAQKEKIKGLSANVDVLTLTATPIPRTLNMAMSGIRDISVLDEAPGDRLPVQTYVLEDDGLIVEEAIRRELRRGGQVFYLHNTVDNINTLAAGLAERIPEARIVVAHGQMDKEHLERVWSDMLTGEIDILVCTTIIETGIDVPNANTLIVDNSHRLGLSQLHQLRGRVGRSPRRAYAYFTYPKSVALGDIQRKRLEAIREYAEFGAGFRIALRDLELRGAGNLLGSQQHGHLDAVGYDLYIKLLNQAVLEEKGETVEEKEECVISLSFDACLPEKYVKFPTQRMTLYKRIALISSTYDLEDMTDELLDRYGDLPVATENLLQIALIRSLAASVGVTQIRQDGATVHIGSPTLDVNVWMELANKYPGKLRMMMSAAPYIQYRMEKGREGLFALRELFLSYRALLEGRGGTGAEK